MTTKHCAMAGGPYWRSERATFVVFDGADEGEVVTVVVAERNSDGIATTYRIFVYIGPTETAGEGDGRHVGEPVGILFDGYRGGVVEGDESVGGLDLYVARQTIHGNEEFYNTTFFGSLA